MFAGQPSVNFEVVYATVVNGSPTAAIVLRGQEGTTALLQSRGTVWACGPTAQDFTSDAGPIPFANVTGLGTAATHAASDFAAAPDDDTAYATNAALTAAQALDAKIANNLSDLTSATTARTNLGLGTAATQASTAFDAAGAAAAAQAASDPAGSAATATASALQKAANLSDVASAATSRTNLGLGTAATHPSTDFDASGAAAAAAAASDPSGTAATAQAYAVQRANHTGTQLLATISDAGTAASHAATDFDAAGAAAAAEAAAIAASDPAGSAAAKAAIASPTFTGTMTLPNITATVTPNTNPNQPGRIFTTGSTAIAATRYGLRKATWQFFDNTTDDVNNAVIGIDIIQQTNPVPSTIIKSGIAVRAFHMPDNGGEVSNFVAIETGGGVGMTAYKVTGLRPTGFTDYWDSPQGAAEFVTDGGSHAVLAIAGAQGYGGTDRAGNAIYVRLDNSLSKGIIVSPRDGVFDARVAIAVGVQNIGAADVGVKFSVSLAGDVVGQSFTASSGGVTVTAGGITVTAGGLTVTAGALAVNSNIVTSTNALAFQPSGVANNALFITNAASAVNGIQFAGSATTVGVVMQTFGSDTNVNFQLNTKGTGNLRLQSASGNVILAPSGTPQITCASGLITVVDAANIAVGTTTGTQIGTGITQKIAFYGSTPVAQRSGASEAAVTTTASTQTTPFGYATQAQANGVVTLVNELRAALVALGLFKGAA